jgi:hypothetical protein
VLSVAQIQRSIGQKLQVALACAGCKVQRCVEGAGRRHAVRRRRARWTGQHGLRVFRRTERASAAAHQPWKATRVASGLISMRLRTFACQVPEALRNLASGPASASTSVDGASSSGDPYAAHITKKDKRALKREALLSRMYEARLSSFSLKSARLLIVIGGCATLQVSTRTPPRPRLTRSRRRRRGAQSAKPRRS